MTEPLTHENLRTPGKRRAPQRHMRAMAAEGSYPSPNYSSRNGTKVTGICIHTAEGPTDANNLGAYFAQPKVQASSHEGADESKRVRYVDYAFEAWTLRNGNPWSDNLEMCGFASWTRAEWLAHPGMLQHAAEWVAERCHARGIPPVRITAADIRAGHRTGYFAHWDYTQGTGDGTHWDVGQNFPWDIFGGLVQSAYNGTTPPQEGFLMALSDQQQAEMYAILKGLGTINPPYTTGPTPTQLVLGDIFVQARRAAAAADPAAIAAAVVKALPTSAGVSEADMETAIRNVLGSLNDKP